MTRDFNSALTSSNGSLRVRQMCGGSGLRGCPFLQAQHFPSVQRFLAETWRVLKSGGRLGVTKFFAESASALLEMKQQIPELYLEMNPISPIEDLMESAGGLGYKPIILERIGPDVFAGFQLCVEVTGCSDDWGPIWDKAYKLGLHDYFVVILEKP